MSASPPFLPAMRHLGDLASMKPVVVTDSREQQPLTFTRLASVTGTLISGDYSIQGMTEVFAVERKSVPDLVQCCMGSDRDRFSRELCRLRGYRFARLLIVGTPDEVMAGQYHSRIKPKAVMHTLSAFEARYVPVAWTDDPAAAAKVIERWAFWFAREQIEVVNDMLRGATTSGEADHPSTKVNA